MSKEGPNQTGGVGLPAGTKIGKYEVRERKAIGGQAIVYKCYDASLDRFVAIKQISTHLAEDLKFLERFRKEAQIFAKLGAEQPAVVTIHELIEDQRGLFIVMEFVAGHSLETILSQTDGPVEPKAALQILWRLAAGLHAVHAAGIVHRDIKPGNIIIGEGLRAKITDFGVAASLTGQTSMLLGTTKYMAPELFAGESVDGRADMYSLGFIAYEMLVGRPKFNEIFADVVRDRHSEAMRWMKWHGNLQVQAPPAHEVDPAVPRALSDIVAKMMAKDRQDRFESMEALGRAIKASFSPRARASREQSKAARAGKPDKQVPAAALAEKEGVGPGDEADQLELAPGPPATVPLPKSRLSVTTKLILAGIIAVSIIAIGVVLGVRLKESQEQRADKAAKDYAAAWEAYQRGAERYDMGEFASARKAFQAVRDKHRSTEYATRASVLAAMTEAQIAVLETDWVKAQNARDEAIHRLRNIKQAGGALATWAGQMEQRIEEFDKHRRDAWKFWEAMKDAEASLKMRKYQEVRRILGERLTGVELGDPKLKQHLEDFQQRLRLAEFQSKFSDHVAAADEAVDRADYDKAQSEYREAEKLLGSGDAEVMDETERGELRKLIGARTSVLLLRRGYQLAADAAEAARKKESKDEELTALAESLSKRDELAKVLDAKRMTELEQAGKVQSQQQLQQRIQELRAKIALDRGLAELQAGRYDDAIKAFEESLKHSPSPEARAALEQAKKAKGLRSLLAEAKKHEDSGELAEALKKYTEAEQLEPSDPAIKAKVLELSYQIALAKADRLRSAKDYKLAAAAYEEARRIKPEASADIDARLALMRQMQRYDDLLALGADALKRKDWTEALRYFEQAQGIQDTQEVRQQINLTRYSENLALGRTAMNRADYYGALAYFKLAQGFMDTEEVRTFIAEAEKQAKESR